MSTAFVELLRKSNLDYIITQKSLKIGSHNNDILFASFINIKTKKLQLIAWLDKSDSVTLWSTSLDEREFQFNARLLDLNELGETMNFLSERINQSDFTLAKGVSTNPNDQNDISQLNVTFTHPKNKQTITIQLHQHTNEEEKASFLSKILLHIYQRNEQLSTEIKTQQIRIKELSTKGQHIPSDSTKLYDLNDSKTHLIKAQERTKMSLINPTTKKRKKATGVNYDEDDSD